MIRADAMPAGAEIIGEALGEVEELCRRHGISALDDFIGSCREFAREKTLNVAVLGRFKAGKSSFLNHLLGRRLLPVGVIPVTSVVTAIEWGATERAEVLFLDGRREAAPVDRIGDFISEDGNPGNCKQVSRVLVELPSMERYQGVRFVDTPGLDSVFEHNTGASLEWLPNVGLALVAVGVDPPLSRHDIDLIRNLSRYTPNISLLLTKVDLLEEAERAQVREFVGNQLARYWNQAPPLFPYSVRPGFEHLRAELDRSLLAPARNGAGEQRAAILRYKLDSLLGECAEYLNVARKAAEAADSQREALRRTVLGQKESLKDARLALRLIVRHAEGSTRSTFEAMLRADEAPVREKLQAELERQFPSWSRSLSVAIGKFEGWIAASLVREISELSRLHRNEFVEPVRRAARQLAQSLQDFRNRLSERMLETLGVPLKTTEMELRTEDPRSPDVRVGRIFDHNWELLSWVIPMALVKGAVRGHYHRKAGELVLTNLSRLASQWEEIANAALRGLEKESIRRLEGQVATIERLIASSGREAAGIGEELARLQALRRRLSEPRA